MDFLKYLTIFIDTFILKFWNHYTKQKQALIVLYF